MEEGLSTSRRLFLRTGLLASTAFALASGRAFAFAVEEASSGVTGIYHAARSCALGDDPQHQKLLVELRQSLDDLSLSPEERDAVVAGLTCPICGCGLQL